MLKKRYMSACALTVLALGLAAPAFAQDAAPATPVAPAADTAQADDSSDQGNIVVTAQGRAQALADVPVAISAVSGETLRNSGANDIRQLNQVAPSLLVSSTGSEANASPRIRGIGTVGDNPGLESSVAVFIDGVYRSRAGIGMNELGEIDRIEVLRGPQGTLGGRNSTAGLISIVSKGPSFTAIGAGAEASYGNYDAIRLAGNVNVPLGETVAARVDGVYFKRDGFYYDPANKTDVNNRDRYFVRGQLLFEPSSDLKIRLIGDYTHRKEKCCAATYVDRSVNPYVGNLNDPVASVNAGVAAGANGNNIVNVLTALGQPLNLIQTPGYSRTISTSPGRSFAGVTRDYGFSGQIDYDLGGARLTSITAYRDYKSAQGSDTDYSTVDILYRAADGNSSRQFKTFTQELRLQGEAFDSKLDWLVGGFFANEDLTVVDNLKFGAQYGRFATCRAVSGGALATFYSPTSQSCIGTTPLALLGGATPRQFIASGAATGGSAVLGGALLGAFDRLDTVNNVGSTIDTYRQNSKNYAFFTHNIFHVTDRFDVTLGVRYTHEKKTFDALFGNNNTACAAQQAALNPFLPTLGATAIGLINLTCQGNSTSELNGVAINDSRTEHKFTGTGILSYKLTDDLLAYASYSRGYKAGGFNLDRSALKAPTATFASQGGAQALVRNLQFDPETVNSFEIGAKYGTGPFSLSVAAFRQDFRNFQLNTFDGTVFVVQNINGCSSSLGVLDNDQSKFTGAANYNPAEATIAGTGICPSDDVTYGVRAQGVELEASLVPARDLRVSLGATFTDTKYKADLVGNQNGAALNESLRVLPGQRLSNSAAIVATTSVAFTPEIGDSGLSALFYVDGRMTSDYNTGSDLFPQKAQDGYALFNARVGLRGKDERWAIEFWGQNIFNKDYAQVAFNSPFQEGAASTTTAFSDPRYPGGRQIFSQYLAEPRTYGVTLRGKF